MTKIELDVVIPEGYEPTGEYRIPKIEEPFLQDGEMNFYFRGTIPKVPAIILRKLKPWREPVLPDDYGKQVQMSNDGKTWFDVILIGWHKDRPADTLAWNTNSEPSCFRYARIRD